MYVVNTGLDQYDEVHDIVNVSNYFFRGKIHIGKSTTCSEGFFLRCWHTQCMDVDEGSQQHLDF